MKPLDFHLASGPWVAGPQPDRSHTPNLTAMCSNKYIMLTSSFDLETSRLLNGCSSTELGELRCTTVWNNQTQAYITYSHVVGGSGVARCGAAVEGARSSEARRATRSKLLL